MTKLKVSQAVDVRLGRQRSPQHETGDHLVPYLRSANITDGVLDLTDVKTMNFTPSEQQIFALQYGDVLVTEGSGSRDTVGTSAVWREEIDGTLCFQNTLLRLRPRPGITDGRFVAWWARHAHASGMFADVATGANILHLSSDGIKRLEIDVPDIDDQRRIADFLDDQVARIDAIVAGRDRQRALVSAQARRLSARSVSGVATDLGALPSPLPWIDVVSPQAAIVPFARVLRLQRGVDLTSDERREGDIPVVTTAGVVGTHDSAVARGPGVVIGRYGTVGAVYYIQSDFWAHNTTLYVSDFYGNEPEWCYHLLRIYPYDMLQARAAVPGINRNDLATELVPLISVEDQRSAIIALREIEASRIAADNAFARSINLLREYKQSLITAAVSGEFDVTTASGRRVPVTA